MSINNLESKLYLADLPIELKANFRKKNSEMQVSTNFNANSNIYLQANNLYDICKNLLSIGIFPCDICIHDKISQTIIDLVTKKLIDSGYEVDFFWRTEKQNYSDPIYRSYDITNYYMLIKNPLLEK